jgi:hypothetical protein
MISRRAAEHFAAEYRETQVKIATLDNEIAELDGKREAHRIKLDWLKSQIEPVLQDISSPAAELPGVQTPAKSGGENAHVEVSHGLRHSIRAVLKTASRGMRPRDILEELVKRGVTFSEGKSSPDVRTYNELYRMSKVGQIRKRGSLYYPHELQ